MKWVTWEQVGVDRMACAWLITKYIDRDAEFLFVPAGQKPLLEAYGIGGTAEGCIKANKEIRHQGAQHVIGTHRWNGIVVQRPGIARRSPDDDRDADDHRDQQAIDQRKRLETCTQRKQH